MIKSRKRKWVEHVAHKGKSGMSVGRKGKIPLGSYRPRWQDNKIGITEIGWGGLDSIDLAQNGEKRRSHVNTAINIRVP
jgi:hypothetical protein